MKSFKDQSRVDWHNSERQKSPSMDDIKTGCLQRIADATEVMAQNYVALQNKVKYLEDDLKRARATRDEYWRRIGALKGVITKLKKKSKL